MAVARPLPDEVALWRGDAQAIQGDVDDFGLANRGKNVPEGRSQRGGQQCMLTRLVLLAAGFTTEPSLSPRPEKQLGLAFLPDQNHLAGATSQCHPNSVPGIVLGAGQMAGDKAGVALPQQTGTDILQSTQLQWPEVVRRSGQGHGLKCSDVYY